MRDTHGLKCRYCKDFEPCQRQEQIRYHLLTCHSDENSAVWLKERFDDENKRRTCSMIEVAYRAYQLETGVEENELVDWQSVLPESTVDQQETD